MPVATLKSTFAQIDALDILFIATSAQPYLSAEI